MIEPIDTLFTVAGIEINFGSFSLRAIPGLSYQTMYRGLDTVYESQREDVDFRITSKDYSLYKTFLTRLTEFSLTDPLESSLVFRFRILESPIPDLTGLFRFKTERIA